MIIPNRLAITRLSERLAEGPPARLQLLTGPRQVGKTTMLLDLGRRTGQHVIYSAGDDPSAALPGAWERIWDGAEDVASRQPAVLILDEIQRWPDWSRRLKGRWDRVARQRLPLHVVASGSSAIHLGRGSRESLAGRFERLDVGHWDARDLAAAFPLSPDAAAAQVVTHGSYPGAQPLLADRARWAAYVRDAIIEPALTRDVLDLADVRKPSLLRQVFAYAAVSPAEIVALKKLQGALHDRSALETVASYLRLLGDAGLVAPLERFSAVARQRNAPPKLVVLNNALASAAHPDGPPDPARDPARWGRWLENACLSYLAGAGLTVRYWREEPYEVDAVVDGAAGSWAIEVKTGVFSERDLSGLAEFVRRYPRYRPLVVTGDAQRPIAERAGFAARTWTSLLTDGLS